MAISSKVFLALCVPITSVSVSLHHLPTLAISSFLLYASYLVGNDSSLWFWFHFPDVGDFENHSCALWPFICTSSLGKCQTWAFCSCITGLLYHFTNLNYKSSLCILDTSFWLDTKLTIIFFYFMIVFHLLGGVRSIGCWFSWCLICPFLKIVICCLCFWC